MMNPTFLFKFFKIQVCMLTFKESVNIQLLFVSIFMCIHPVFRNQN